MDFFTSKVSSSSDKLHISTPGLGDNMSPRKNVENSEGSDYVLESDSNSSSPRSKKPLKSTEKSNQTDNNSKTTGTSTHAYAETQEYYSQYTTKSGPTEVKKTGSTGDLRMYNKTDLKNRIKNLDHRILTLEKRVAELEKHTNIIPEKNDSVPFIIKAVAISLVFLHSVRYI